jgi:hypothetical protein
MQNEGRCPIDLMGFIGLRYILVLAHVVLGASALVIDRHQPVGKGSTWCLFGSGGLFHCTYWKVPGFCTRKPTRLCKRNNSVVHADDADYDDDDDDAYDKNDNEYENEDENEN